MNWIIPIGIGVVTLVFATGIRIVRPTERGLIETFGKYSRFASGGFNWIIPLVQRLYTINTTEQMVDAKKQEIITKDRLNASVDAQVYFKVRQDEESVKKSQYEVNNYTYQIVNLARTTLRNIIGNLSLEKANSDRDAINQELMTALQKETSSWGIDIVRTELKEIDPPQDVQQAMNKVVKAENEKEAAKDYALAKQTEADGERMADIKRAEGRKQARILEAEGKAKAFDLVNKSFVGNAQLLKQYEVTENSLVGNSKIILTERGINPVVVFGEEKIIPIKK